jgi:CelD/BcsL family acetyltransferase involved in cellulose biosynthesis
MVPSQINAKTRMFSKLKLAEPSKAVAAEWQQLQASGSLQPSQQRSSRAGPQTTTEIHMKKLDKPFKTQLFRPAFSPYTLL